MKKVIISALLMLSASFAASAGDDVSVTLPANGYFVTSCGYTTYTVPPGTYFDSYEDMIESYNEINQHYCGKPNGWQIAYNYQFWDAYTLIYLGIDFNPTV